MWIEVNTHASKQGIKEAKYYPFAAFALGAERDGR
jgi:hypothetical protein